jgi:membrane-bound serine protease (ClpP class)
MSGIIISLVIAGLLLLLSEVFLPGLVAGTIGALLELAAIVLCYDAYGVAKGTLLLVAILFLNCIGFVAWLYFFPKSFIGRKLTLSGDNPTSHPDYAYMLGREGVAVSQLRPTGVAMIDGKRVDVLAEEGFIAAQDTIKVVQVEGPKVIVRKR